MVNRIAICCLILLFNYSLHAQQLVRGKVMDKQNNSALPHVNIGIKNKHLGTCSRNDGSFSLQIPASNSNDTLTFSMVGYETQQVALNAFEKNLPLTLLLVPRTVSMPTFIFHATKTEERKIGLSKTSLIRFTDASINQQDIFEIAQLIQLGSTRACKITSVNLHINESAVDSGLFRINFYKFEDERPGERLFDKSIVQNKKIEEGWLKFDISSYQVYLKNNFVVAIEFLPTSKKKPPIYYEVKIGGKTKSFVRTNSQDAWMIPPAHYKLFVTALVDQADKNDEPTEEEQESKSTCNLFSKSVNDSFSLFIHLPKDYDHAGKESYPVIYLLDANVFFDAISSELTRTNSEIILVGIGYKNFYQMDSLRERDYTYPPILTRNQSKINGGAENFYRFIQDELQPFIQTNYRCNLQRQGIMGHSLGGYFVLYSLLRDLSGTNAAFNHYAAASPSFEYADYFLQHEFQKIQEIKNSSNNYLYLSYGALEDVEDRTEEQNNLGIANFTTFVKLLSNEKFSSLKLKHELFPKFGHMETATPSFFQFITTLAGN